MLQEEFFELIRSSVPDTLADSFLRADTVHLFSGRPAYDSFRVRVGRILTNAELIAVVGSGNWQYSLNPDKAFREFGKHSDVDVAVISERYFHNLWEEMRGNHREHFYALSYEARKRLRRDSENVYAGFISPEWIPNRDPYRAFEYRRLLNILSDQRVLFLKVKMMFFKNMDEAIDYYARGFRAARKAIQ